MPAADPSGAEDEWVVEPAWAIWARRLLLTAGGALALTLLVGLAQLAQLQADGSNEFDPGAAFALPAPSPSGRAWPATTEAAPSTTAPVQVDEPQRLSARTESAPLPADRAPASDGDWVARVSSRTGIPPRALRAYATAHLIVERDQPECGIGWNTLAGIGWVESKHGSHGGAALGEDGYPRPSIVGIPLDGDGVAAIRDTDGGAWDGDAVWDRAVGPMQFIPSTWKRWGADANGDGWADPNQIDDAALAAARYLCASGPMDTSDGWRDAVFSYNHLTSYVNHVARAATEYAERTERFE